MTDDMRGKLPQYVYAETGKRTTGPAFYFRKGKGRRIRLPDYGTPGFEEAYLAARRMELPPLERRAEAGTIGWLIDLYRASDVYRGKATATRRQRDNIFKGVRKSAGGIAVSRIDVTDIRNGLKDRVATPAQARHFLNSMHGLFEWAVENGFADADPTAGVKPPKPASTDGHAPWTDADIAAYEHCWPAGTHERVWMHVLLYTGFRRGDAVVFGRQHVRDGIATIKTEKNGTEVTIRVPAELVATLATGPTGDLAFIVGKKGEPLSKEGFGNLFRAAVKKAELIDRSAHGLRKTAATRFAEGGATEAELDALFGWTGRKMASLYTKKAERKRMALQAADRMANNRPAPLYPDAPHLKNTATKS